MEKTTTMDIRYQVAYRRTLWLALLCFGVGASLLTPLSAAYADTDPTQQMLLGKTVQHFFCNSFLASRISTTFLT